MSRISTEGISGLVLALIVVMLEQAGIKNPFVLWAAFAAAAFLCVDWLRKSDRARKTKILLITATFVAFAAFGLYLARQSVQQHKEITNVSPPPPSATPIPFTPTVASPSPRTLQRTVRPVLSLKPTPAPAMTPVPTPTSSPIGANAPFGIAISGGNVTNPTVNNFAPPQRILTEDQRKAFVGILRTYCPFEIAVRGIPGNAESMAYAEQLMRAIKEAGCTLRRPKFLIDTSPSYGLWVILHDKENIPTGADALMEALSKTGSPAKGTTLDVIEPGVVYLMVGFNDTKLQ
jgi:hypothetical protein